jgi:hypothetical protein
MKPVACKLQVNWIHNFYGVPTTGSRVLFSLKY